MPEQENLQYMTFTLRRYNSRYYQTTINGVLVAGTAEELIGMIDEFLLKQS